MKKLLIAISIAAFGFTGTGHAQSTLPLQLKAADFHYLDKIPTDHGAGAAFGCPGNNEPITFSWSNLPPGTQSLALTIVDYTVPGPPGYFTHWIAYNIPPTVKGIGPNTLSGVTQGMNDAGLTGYFGMCPPDIPPQPHVYTMTLYALDETGLPAGMDFPQFRSTIQANNLQHELAVAYYAGTYHFQRVKAFRLRLRVGRFSTQL